MPPNLLHTIFICGKPQWYGKPLKQLGLLSRQAHIRRVTGRIAAIGVASRGKISERIDGKGIELS
jgi:hypothetical protein